MDIFVEQFPFLGTKIVQKTSEKHWGKNYINANVYIYFFPQKKVA